MLLILLRNFADTSLNSTQLEKDIFIKVAEEVMIGRVVLINCEYVIALATLAKASSAIPL
jgi:hypothetical protein